MFERIRHDLDLYEERCWLYNECPCRTGGCYGLPDEGCPIYRWFKQIIEKEK